MDGSCTDRTCHIFDLRHGIRLVGGKKLSPKGHAVYQRPIRAALGPDHSQLINRHGARMIATWFVLLAVALTAVAADVPVVTRAEWNARPASGDIDSMETPLARAVIAHTGGGGCSDDQGCANLMRNLQQYQMTRQRFSDIGYHYLIGGNGRVYEGRSPSQRGAFAGANNEGSLGIAFMGNFDEQPPSDAALEAGKSLLEQAVGQGQLAESYQLLGHRQVSATKSPGDALYTLVQQWPHWSEI
ncbi:peptidoglycan-recognition protein SD [Drosophila persimilis]|nr:peptidoglycan-recognition protein SD [Drosophila persimilis]